MLYLINEFPFCVHEIKDIRIFTYIYVRIITKVIIKMGGSYNPPIYSKTNHTEVEKLEEKGFIIEEIPGGDISLL